MEWFSYYIDDSSLKNSIHDIGEAFQLNVDNAFDKLKSKTSDNTPKAALILIQTRLDELIESIPEENRNENPAYLKLHDLSSNLVFLIDLFKNHLLEIFD